MIGQQKLLQQIQDYIARDKFPRFSIVVGERGMGHEDVGRMIASYLECPCVLLQDVKVDTIRNMIKEAYSQHEKMVYIIPHADEMSVNAKNALLKVVEETPNKAYFVMCLEDLSNTLATIASRGMVFRMDRPTTAQIREFCEGLFVEDVDTEVVDIAANVCSTPGEVYLLTKLGAKNFYSYVEWVAENLFTSGGAEALNLCNKVSVKDGDDKYDCLLFMRALQIIFMSRACKSAINGEEDKAYTLCSISECIGKYMRDLRIRGINRQMLLDNFVLEVRKIWKSQM